MKELKIIATIVAKEEHKEAIVASLKKVVDMTRKEEGNISYELHSDINTPLKYIIIEVWKSQEAINLHNDSAHFGAFVEEIEGKVESLAVDVIEAIY
ncbi:MAG: putative quinol monooxygenase [Rikenellaceae bacterium]